MIVSNRAWWRTRATICRRSFQSIKNTRPLRRVVKRRKYSKPALNQRIWLALLGGLNRHTDFSCEQKDNKEKRKKNAKKKTSRKFQDLNRHSQNFNCTRVNRLRHVNTCSPPDENLNNSFFLFRFVASIAYASIFCPRFSQKQSANQAKKLQGNVFLLNWKAQAKIQVLLKKKKNLPEKVTYNRLAPSHSTIEVKTWTRPLLATQSFMQINVLDQLNQLVTSIIMTITCKHFLILRKP